MSRKRPLGGLEVGRPAPAPRPRPAALLDLGVGGELLVLLGLGGVAGAEEGVLGAAEPLPQRVVDVARRRAGGLPLPHQVAEPAGRRAPVGGVGQALGLLGQPLLDHPGGVALLVLLGEVRLAAPGVRRPGGGEPAPQRVVGGPVDAGQRLPLVEQLAQPVGAVAPVVALGELLGLGDDGLLRDLRLGGALGPLGLARLALASAITGPSASSRPASAARSPTALASTTCSRTVFTDSAGLLGRQHAGPLTRCSSSSTSNASASYRSVKKRQRLLGRALGVLAHGALAVGGPDEDRAVLGDPAPLVARHWSSSSSGPAAARPMLVKGDPCLRPCLRTGPDRCRWRDPPAR